MTKLEKFTKEYNDFLDEGKLICMDCLEKKFGKYIGDRKKYDDMLKANTVYEDKCELCGKKKTILPYHDLYVAIKASLGEKTYLYEFD